MATGSDEEAIIVMDTELLTNLAPAAVYLLGLVAAIKHITKLYDSRHKQALMNHDEIIEIIERGHEARFALLEASAKECFEDRKLLRDELNTLRDRVLLLSAGPHDVSLP